MICLISFSKCSDVLPAFTCAIAIVNLSSICLGVNIFNRVARSEELPFPCVCIGNIPLLKTLIVNCRPY